MATKAQPLSTFTDVEDSPVRPTALPDPEPAQTELRQKVFRLTPAQARALKKFCADSDMTMQEVIIEGINLVLKARGLPTI
jgi:hypothetical protein